jgi:CDP-glucose 4,6-dehydratase
MKAIGALGWSPRWPLESALAETVGWYKAHRAGRNDMRGVSLEQIDAHGAAR